MTARPCPGAALFLSDSPAKIRFYNPLHNRYATRRAGRSARCEGAYPSRVTILPHAASELIPRSQLRTLFDVDHMPIPGRIAYLGLMAISAMSLLFLMPNFLIYLATAQSMVQLNGVVMGIVGLLAAMFTMAAIALQIVLVLKLPERLAWVRNMLSLLVVATAIEAVLSDWMYPTVLHMGFRWDILISLVMVALLWTSGARQWFGGDSRRMRLVA